MSLIESLESLAARPIERGLGPIARHLTRTRRSEALERGMPDDAAISRAKNEWWGDEPVWFAGGTPPRRHNRITPLIDGQAYLDALIMDLEQATSHVFIAGWCLTPHIPLRRDDPQSLTSSQLLPVLLETARRIPVRLLIWAGAPFLIQPTERATREVRQEIESEARRLGVDLAIVLDKTAHPSHCHHQKTVVIDSRVAFVGGMDITTFQGDRWDRAGHPLRAGLNWHDVQSRIEGEAVADVESNFRQRWAACSDERLPAGRKPAIDESMSTLAQIVRTIPPRTYDFAPDGEFGIHHALTTLIRRAQRLIYLENQYLWSPEVVDALHDAIQGPHAGQLRIIVVLPARAYSGKWDNDRRVTDLRRADENRGFFEAYSLYASGPHLGARAFRYRPIYVHAKVSIVDDEWLSIGSANLNTRGLVTDSELNVIAHDPALAKRVRIALWSEHLAMSREEVASVDPGELAARAWPARAAENAAIVQRGDGPLHGLVHRYETGRMPGSFVLEEAESLTFEH
jgi:phosphatidylserine/phosphatidylglycerophosphate/cardiolipin synthase-like enzyme